MVTFIKSKKFLLILFLLLFVSGSTAFALEIDWPLSPGGTVLNDDSDVGDMIQYFYEWAIALGGLATFVSLVFGGFKYLSSMGRPEAMKEAKDQITSAFAGLVLLLSAWLILNVINPDLTTFRKTSYNLSYLIENPPGIVLSELPGCDYVKLYPQENFGGSPLTIVGKTGPESDRLTGEDGYYTVGVGNVGSVKSFSKGALEEFGCCDTCDIVPDPDCECEGHACGCTLELYAKGYDKETQTVLDCGDKLGEVPAWDKDLLSHEGEAQEINCVRLSGIACECRIVDSDNGECTTEISPDTAWGDDKFNCAETEKDLHNRRCLDGKCITCKGTVLEDGCGGCSNDDLAPGSASEFACWYKAPKRDWTVLGHNCHTVCKEKAGNEAICIPKNWDDYNSCTVGTSLSSCSCGLESDYMAAPWLSVVVTTLTCQERRPDTQRCGDRALSLGQRLCVCDR